MHQLNHNVCTFIGNVGNFVVHVYACCSVDLRLLADG